MVIYLHPQGCNKGARHCRVTVLARSPHTCTIFFKCWHLTVVLFYLICKAISLRTNFIQWVIWIRCHPLVLFLPLAESMTSSFCHPSCMTTTGHRFKFGLRFLPTLPTFGLSYVLVDCWLCQVHPSPNSRSAIHRLSLWEVETLSVTMCRLAWRHCRKSRLRKNSPFFSELCTIRK